MDGLYFFCELRETGDFEMLANHRVVVGTIEKHPAVLYGYKGKTVWVVVVDNYKFGVYTTKGKALAEAKEFGIAVA